MIGKQIITALAVVFTLATATSCKRGGGLLSSNSAGKPYELVLSVGDNEWAGEVGDTLRAVLSEPVRMLNQQEPRLDVVRVKPGALGDLLLRHRNILIVSMDPELDAPKSVARYDAYAAPQIIVDITAPNHAALVEYLSENRRAVQQLFDATERDRALANALKYNAPEVERKISELFGIEMSVPSGFALKTFTDTDFLWFGQDNGIASQGVVMYTYPFSGKDDFTPARLLARRNEFVSRIPGPSEGSFMTTSDYIEPEMRAVQIDGHKWAEMRGFWDVEGAFMGGPFVSYSTINPNTGWVVAIDCYVFSPKDPKRNMLRALEHLVYSVRFPAPQPEPQPETQL